MRMSIECAFECFAFQCAFQCNLLNFSAFAFECEPKSFAFHKHSHSNANHKNIRIRIPVPSMFKCFIECVTNFYSPCKGVYCFAELRRTAQNTNTTVWTQPSNTDSNATIKHSHSNVLIEIGIRI